jgi:hypothetical protein
MSTIELLKRLDNLILSGEPYTDAESIIEELCEYYNLTVPLTPKTVIIRARCNEGDEHFNSKSELTYPPKSRCSKCSRAAIPREQMFYACTFENGNIPRSLIAAAIEANFSIEKQTRITFGYWRVKKEIELIVVLPDKNFSNLSPAATILKDKFFNNISEIEPVELRESTIAIAKYFSGNFSKKIVNGCEYEYILSAEFSKYLIKKGFDGILYPSVQFDGEVLNIALSPEIADTNLELEGVREYKFSHNKLYCEFYADLYPSQTHFQLLPNLNTGLEYK